MRAIPPDPRLEGLSELLPAGGVPPFVASATGEMLGETLDPGTAEVEYVRYWPGKGCVVLWSLAASDGSRRLVSGRLFADDQGERLVERTSFRRLAASAAAASETATPTHRFLPDRRLLLLPFPMDGRLSGLPDADTDRWAREALAPAVGLDPASVNRIERRPVSFKPWRRCVYHYRLHAPDEAPGFFAKVFRDERGGAFFERARAVHRELHRARLSWDTPRALAYLPAEKILVFEELPGAVEISDLLHGSLRDARARDRLLEAFEMAGEAIGQLRDLELDELPCLPPAAVLSGVRRRTKSIERVAPGFGRVLAEQLDRLGAEAETLEPEPLVPTHGAFRHDQLVLHDGRLAVLDLDGLCLSGRSADAGYFLGMLDVVAVRRPKHRKVLEAGAVAFLEGLERSGGASPEWLAWYRAAAQVKKAVRSFLSLDRKWPDAAAALENGLVQATLNRGGRAA